MLSLNKIETIDEYINMFPDQVKEKLYKLRKVIKDVVPNCIETISYQMPTFKLSENLVRFAAYKNHIGFYPTPSAIEHFKDKLYKYKFAKGSIQFPINEELPFDLIKEIVEFRVKNVTN